MINYKLREEKNGAFVFNRLNGSAEKISEEAYQKMLLDEKIISNPEWQIIKHSATKRKALPSDALSAPARIYFELTRKCNLGCKACFNESSLPMENELTTKEIFSILDQLNEIGTFEIRFTGGEPTTRKDFFEIIAYAKKLGFYISMGTNGIYPNDLFKKVANCGVDWFIVSLDGMEDANDFIRGKGSFKKTKKSLKEFAKLKKRIRVNTVVGKYNLDQIPALAKFADSINAESLNLIPLRPYGRAIKYLSDKMFSQNEFYDMIRLIDNLRSKHKVKIVTTIDLLNKNNLSKQDLIVKKEKTCAAGVEAAVISPCGSVYGCSYSPASERDDADVVGRNIFVAGDLRKEKIEKIWLDSNRWSVFRDLKNYKSSACHSCAYYKKECVGSCPIMSYHKDKTLNGLDPYCFKDLLKGVCD
jgi:radical SAM protein with 4Fe4S-binding SPASM domain